MAKLLEAYGGREAVVADPKGATEVLRKASRGNLTSEKVDAVIESAWTSYGCPMIEDERLTLRVLAGDLLYQRYMAIEAESRIHALIVDDEELEHTGKTFGKVTAAIFYALVGDLKKFDSVGALLKAFGLNMKIWSSGKKDGQLHITKRGSSVARWYMYLAALRMIKGETIVKAWYDRKVARDGGRVKLKAVIAVMRKLIGALWHVAQGKTFDASLLFDTSRLQLVKRGPHEAGAVCTAV